MTIGIAGPVRREPWRGVVVALLGGAIVLVIGLVLLALASNFLVDWLWFGTLGYVSVFWTTIATEAAVFGIVFVATAGRSRFDMMSRYCSHESSKDGREHALTYTDLNCRSLTSSPAAGHNIDTRRLHSCL